MNENYENYEPMKKNRRTRRRCAAGNYEKDERDLLTNEEEKNEGYEQNETGMRSGKVRERKRTMNERWGEEREGMK